MKLEAQVIARKCRAHLTGEVVARIEARDLILVLVGHELEQIARDRVYQALLAGSARGFRRLHLLDQRAIARRVGGVLIASEERNAARDDLVERLREAARLVDFLGGGELLDRDTIHGGIAAEAERHLVHFDRLAVELDRMLDRRSGERQRADLE